MIGYDFSGKKILITGSTSGLGLEVSRSLSGSNASLVISGRNQERLNAASQELKLFNRPLHNAILADLTDPMAIANLAESVGVLDGLVLNAGVIDYTPAKMINSDRIRFIFQVNFEANVMLIQNLLKRRKISRNASIVFISSISSLLGVQGTSLYAASKAALTSYAKVLASELAGQRIRVNTVSPGIIKTHLIERENVASTGQLAALEAKYPLGFGGTADVTGLIRFLLSDESKWMTGSNIIIDGGYMLQ